ncbi:MAG: endoglucanase A [Deltaproteobacteria bacterium]|nr:endoglucanase A [Deltaproteobacteria bacterium]
MQCFVRQSSERVALAALVIGSVCVYTACGSGEAGKLDAGADAPAAPPDTAPPDIVPLHACPSALPSPAVLDGGLLPSRRPAGALPSLAAALSPGALPATDVVFTIDTSQGVWPISQDIYGMNSPFPDQTVDATLRATSLRLGGNRWSAYNWENNASNAGKDWQFQNDGYLSASDAPGDAVRFALGDAHAMGGGAVLTVPIGDYVSADKAPGGDVRGDGGTDYLATRFRKNVARKGAPPSDPPDVRDDSVYQDEFVAWAKGCAGTMSLAFCLDNEPGLWKETHPEIHPAAVTYDELCQRTVTFATGIKAAWPAAPVLGFVSYGWNGYTTLQNAPDAKSKGDFIEYFLAQMQIAEANAGRRLVDYLDLHWYPEARGGGARIVFDAAPTGAASLAAYEDARLQAPRSLWDSTYEEASWIIGNLQAPINLIPRIQQKIAAHYPGTKLSFTEWNYGGGGDITGAIATADVLGILGRERVAMAHIWPLSTHEPFTAAGFRVFRNYDGRSGEFGDVGIPAGNTDPVNTSVYASLSSSDPRHVVVVAINKKSDATVTAGIRLAHPASFGSARVYLLAGTAAEIVAGPGLAALDVNAFSYAMPPRSVSVLVFDGGGTAPGIDGGVSIDGSAGGPLDGGGGDDGPGPRG